jgi:hypothetical protein
MSRVTKYHISEKKLSLLAGVFLLPKTKKKDQLRSALVCVWFRTSHAPTNPMVFLLRVLAAKPYTASSILLLRRSFAALATKQATSPVFEDDAAAVAAAFSNGGSSSSNLTFKVNCFSVHKAAWQVRPGF